MRAGAAALRNRGVACLLACCALAGVRRCGPACTGSNAPSPADRAAAASHAPQAVEGRACVICVNKWDTVVERTDKALADYEADVRAQVSVCTRVRWQGGAGVVLMIGWAQRRAHDWWRFALSRVPDQPPPLLPHSTPDACSCAP